MLPWPMLLRWQGLAHFVLSCHVPFEQTATSVAVHASILWLCEHAAPMVTGSFGVQAGARSVITKTEAVATMTRTARE